jgi:hypothetical protein
MLLFIIAQPLLQSDDGSIPWYTDKVAFPPEVLGSEARAAVEGLTYVCSIDVLAGEHPSTPAANGAPAAEASASHGTAEVASVSSARKELQLQCFSVLTALLPVMQQCPEHITDDPSTANACDSNAKWGHNLQKAALRALKSHLPPQHTMNVLLALNALVQQHGAASLLQRVDESDDSAKATDLMITLAQVVKVAIFSHLQGCSLEVQAAKGSQPLPSHLLASQSLFSASIYMIAHLVELSVILDSSADDMDEDEPCGGQVSVVTTAAMEGTNTEVTFSICNSACCFEYFCSHLGLLKPL